MCVYTHTFTFDHVQYTVALRERNTQKSSKRRVCSRGVFPHLRDVVEGGTWSVCWCLIPSLSSNEWVGLFLAYFLPIPPVLANLTVSPWPYVDMICFALLKRVLIDLSAGQSSVYSSQVFKDSTVSLYGLQTACQDSVCHSVPSRKVKKMSFTLLS